MKKRIKDIIIGFIIGCMLVTTTPVLANTILQKIDVVLNGINVEVNGEKLDSNSILYNGLTYLPLRKVAESVGKEVEWNQETMTANIVNKKIEDVKVGEVSLNNFTTYEKDGYEFGTDGINEYYTTKYLFDKKDIAKYECFIDWNENTKKLTIYNNDKNYIIENVEYVFYENRIFIKQSYYETVLLPAISKQNN